MDTESGRGGSGAPEDEWYRPVSDPGATGASPPQPSLDPSQNPFGAPVDQEPFIESTPFGNDTFTANDPFTTNDPFAGDPFGPPPTPLKPAKAGGGPALKIIGIGGLVVLALGGITAGVIYGATKSSDDSAPTREVAAPTSSTTTTAPTTTAKAFDPCDDVVGELKTSGEGDRSTPIRLIAALEHAFYGTKDPDAVAALYVPPGVDRNVLATAIADVKPGTKYCVGATQMDPTHVSMNVNVVDPGGQKVLYKNIAEVTPASPYAIVRILPAP